jgi:hypothetical protein
MTPAPGQRGESDCCIIHDDFNVKDKRGGREDSTSDLHIYRSICWNLLRDYCFPIRVSVLQDPEVWFHD